METSVMSSDVNSTPPKSARKRILFPGSPNDDEGSDSTLGHMSPLSLSSPDRYSSPPPSPQWLMETPPKKDVQHWLSQSPFGPIERKIGTRKSPRVFHTPSKQRLPLSETPQKDKQKIKTDTINDMELVEESPMKDSSNIGLMTPFKSLVGKEKKGEETPKQKSQKLVIGESPDIFSPAAPVKVFQKAKLDDEPGTVLKPVHGSTCTSKLSSLPTSSFYQTSRARASLFPDNFSRSKNSVSLVIGSKKRKQSLSSESHSYMHFSLSGSKYQGAKRRKLGEINAGVHHRIKKHRKKKLMHKQYAVDIAQPKITPNDRIHSYLDRFEPSTAGTNNFIDTEIDEHFTPSQSVQTYPIGTSQKNSSAPLISDREKSTPPSSPLPDPSRKFFKTRRTLKINTSATITVEKNIKLNVSNGKFSLSKPETKSKSCKIPKLDLSTSYQNKDNGMFAEESIAEVLQDTVHDDVEILLKNLEESPKNLLVAGDLQSPNHHISAITTSTSSLAINDGPSSQHSPLTSQTLPRPSSKSAFEAGLENIQKDFLFVDLPEGEKASRHDEEKEKENCNKKYFPVFYKGAANKKLADLTNVKSPRGNKRLWKSTGDNQYIIDAGQKKFGATQCKECGIVYELGDPDDELSHQKYHDNNYDLKYSAWKNERVVAYYGSERVILIKPNDPKPWLNKVKDVLNIVDKELGYADTGLGNLSNSQIYLYVTGKQVIGCIVAHSIKCAYKMLISTVEGCDCCSEEMYPAKCGISRVWVAKNYRRKKIASRIMDSMRSSFIHGYFLGMDEFAFSAPTIEGKAFAEKYTGTVNYLVYT